ncbi:hypothetical protein HMPREF0083_04611 [Aneurinibacillus aneurinilyticus ATCC 12856]|uniref:Uncharacterized protein n=1 Tax=Aneurinibacillus aneurinilyticus ATCC 12856 TaxID=649747 RepID=U1Y5A7_ANEAE|nr:hypothetical protein HMPREF0083_04611 [Aneurinibacillus aneurinilyticus ATCC 12856]
MDLLQPERAAWISAESRTFFCGHWIQNHQNPNEGNRFPQFTGPKSQATPERRRVPLGFLTGLAGKQKRFSG